MAGGNKWIPPVNLVDIFVQNKCHRNKVAQELGITRVYLWEILKDNAEVRAIFDEAQKIIDDEWVEKAESIMYQALDMMARKPNLAMRAAEYILTRKGAPHGWNPIPEEVTSENSLSLKVNYPNAERNPVEVFPESLPTIDN